MARIIRAGVFETNSSSTHSLIVMSNDEYESWKKGDLAINLYTGEVKPLDPNKKYEEKYDGTIIYNGKEYDSIYDLVCDEFDDFGDEYATWDYVDRFAETVTKKVGDKVAMSVYRGEIW